MNILVVLSQGLLYISFAILLGSFILILVPTEHRPAIYIPRKLLMLSAATIPIFAFVPVLDITLYIAKRFGFMESMKIVLTTYTVGTAWIFTLLISIVLVIVITVANRQHQMNKWFAFLSALFTIASIFTIAMSSHASSIDRIIGISSDFIHLLSVSVWVGILLIIGWCATNTENWLNFLKWFTLVAIGCLSATALSGLFLMNLMVDAYIDAWMVSYGQGLFLKHLFLLPLIFYALINSVWVKFKLTKNPQYDPIPSVRTEGFILLTIFILTAIFSQQSPPHGHYLTTDAVSPLFRLFHSDTIQATSNIGFVVNSSTVIFFFLTLLFIALTIVAYFKKAPIVLSFLFSSLFVISFYSMFMVTTVIR